MAGVELERLKFDVQETDTLINRCRQMAEGGPCSAEEITRQIDAINIECCDEPSEDCSGGKVHNFNAGCSALITPLVVPTEAAIAESRRNHTDVEAQL